MDEEEIINELERFDEKNMNIILTLYAHGRLRFNELLRALKEYGLKISQPVLSERLKYLIKRKWVTRKRLGKQYVVYGLNIDKIEALKPKVTPEETKSILDLAFFKELQILKPTPQEDIDSLIRFFLYDLLSEIEFRLKMKNTSEISRYLWFRSSLYGRVRENIIKRTLEDLSYRAKFFWKLEKKLRN